MKIIWDLDLSMINVMFHGQQGVVKILSKIILNITISEILAFSLKILFSNQATIEDNTYNVAIFFCTMAFLFYFFDGNAHYLLIHSWIFKLYFSSNGMCLSSNESMDKVANNNVY